MALSVKVMNDTAGPNRLVPTLLVFSVLTRIPVTPIDFPVQNERMKAMNLARKKVASVMAKEGLSNALKMNVPVAESGNFLVGSEVLLYQ